MISSPAGFDPTFAEITLYHISALPNEPPEISGRGSNYAYGDTLDLNCSSKPSYPPSKLTWSAQYHEFNAWNMLTNLRYINDEAAQPSWVEDSLSKTEAQLYHSEARLTMRIGSRWKLVRPADFYHQF